MGYCREAPPNRVTVRTPPNNDNNGQPTTKNHEQTTKCRGPTTVLRVSRKNGGLIVMPLMFFLRASCGQGVLIEIMLLKLIQLDFPSALDFLRGLDDEKKRKKGKKET